MISRILPVILLVNISLYATLNDEEINQLKNSVLSNDIEKTKILLARADNINAIRMEEHNSSLLHTAVWLGHAQIVNELLKYPINVNIKDDRGNTPFHIAIAAHSQDTEDNQRYFEGFTAIMRHPDTDFNATNNDGENPLHVTLILNWKDPVLKISTVIFLCGGTDLPKPKKTNLNQKDRLGRSPLLLSFLHQDRGIREILFFKDGIKVNQTFKQGLTLLHLATMNGEFSVVERLLHRKAKVNAIAYIDQEDPKKRITPLQIAHDNNFTMIINLLKEKGGIIYS